MTGYSFEVGRAAALLPAVYTGSLSVSTSAFVYAFRTDMGCSPQAYMRGRRAPLGAAGQLRDERLRPPDPS